MTALAIIGGSGFDQLDGLDIHDRKKISTPYGMPSGLLCFGTLFDSEIIFLPRHGDTHAIPPHKINYRGNLYALRSQGVKDIISFAAVGGITSNYLRPSIVIPHQIIDCTWGREHTYHDGVTYYENEIPNSVEHIEFTEPFEPQLRGKLINAAKQSGIAYIDTGVYAVTQGPRLETAAEINRLEIDGADIVGMTVMPEAALAKELNLNYACIALIVNAAAGRGDEVITMEIINRNLAATRVQGLKLLEYYDKN